MIPNTFTPNGDAVNDVWTIAGLENDSNAEILIYARSGNLVYKTTGKNPLWDGLSNGKQAAVGTYYYIIKTKSSVKPISGTVTIIR